MQGWFVRVSESSCDYGSQAAITTINFKIPGLQVSSGKGNLEKI